MVKNYFILLAFIVCGSAVAQKNILLTNTVLIAEIKSNEINVSIDSAAFLKALNYEFNEKFDNFEVKIGETIGDRKEKFYYMNVSSGTNGSNIVRWLTNKNGKLYLENSIQEETGYKDYYVACKGDDQCKPKIYTSGTDIFWICGETPGCKTEEEAKRNPCSRELSLVFSE